jgi:hypothetical protein
MVLANEGTCSMKEKNGFFEYRDELTRDYPSFSQVSV